MSVTVSPDDIQHAAQRISAGEVVAFPTETVYALGADALNEDAVRRIFALKGRPARNPLIVHCLGIAHARLMSSRWPDQAHDLANRFWPGPLTIVVPKNPRVPGVVTGGGETVALRVPDHDIARALIRASGAALVGPSANPSGGISPTTADHVRSAFPDVPILDAGPSATGIESTVVTFATDTPRVLRQGILGHEELGVAPLDDRDDPSGPLGSPGRLRSHYAPYAALVLADRDTQMSIVQDVPEPVIVLELSKDAETCARELYARLRSADEQDPATIVVVEPDGEGPIWDAIRDRLRRAAAPRD